MTAKQLINSVLLLTIQGKLVHQDVTDEPASVLIDIIRKKRDKLVKDKIIRVEKRDSYIYFEDGHWYERIVGNKKEVSCIDDELPFSIPKGWVWVRWGMLGDYKKGPFGSSLTKAMFVPKGVDTVKVYEQKNAIQKNYSLGEYYISKQKYNEMKGFTVYPNDIIVSCAGTIGETYQLPDEAPIGIINQALMRARLHYLPIAQYWLLYFSYILLIENKLVGAGSAIKNIPPFEKLKSMLVALPPLAEQARILKEYNKVLALIKEYGEAYDEASKMDAELPDKLKKSILQEAIMGKLGTQDHNDEPASVLLEQIREEKKKLVKDGVLKKKDLEETPVEDSEIAQKILDGWEYVKLPFVTSLIDGNKREGDFVCLDAKFLRGKSSGEKLPRGKFVKKDDNIILVDGENSGEVFTVPCDGYMGSTFKQLWVSGKMYLPYVLYFIRMNKDILRNSKKGAAIPHLNKELFNNLIIGIPPLAEQHRIVQKIEELYAEIDNITINNTNNKVTKETESKE